MNDCQDIEHEMDKLSRSHKAVMIYSSILKLQDDMTYLHKSDPLQRHKCKKLPRYLQGQVSHNPQLVSFIIRYPPGCIPHAIKL